MRNIIGIEQSSASRVGKDGSVYTARNGVAVWQDPYSPVLGSSTNTLQAASIGSTNLTVGTSPGLYRVDYDLEVTTADAVTPAGTVTFAVTATDRIGARTQTAAAVALTATNRQSGSYVVWLGSGNITYTATVVTIGTSKYALAVRATYLG